MLDSINEKLAKIDFIETKEDIIDIFKDTINFKVYTPKLDNLNSLKIARFFSEVYAYENCIDKELLEYLNLFVLNTENVLALENMYYTGFPNKVSDLIYKKIIELDVNLSTSYNIFNNEGCEYCPTNMLVNILNKSEISEKTSKDFYEILSYLKKNSHDFESIKSEINCKKIDDMYNFCIKNKIISDDMIIYLKDCSENDKTLDYQSLNQLSKALEIFLNKKERD